MQNNVNPKLIKVLFVEDEETMYKLLEKFAAKIGCPAAFARNGEEAVELAKQYRFDVCFMDLFMPKMNGVTATMVIHEEIDHTLPVVALTSSSIDADEEKCKDSGMVGFLTKPVTQKSLKEAIVQYGSRG